MTRAFMIKIASKYTRFILPGIILQGEKHNLKKLMQDPGYVERIGIPESCFYCRYELVPLEQAEEYFEKLGPL